MEFGLFVNTEHAGKSLGEAWEEDLFDVVTADRLGMQEAWISEHGVTPELLICKAAAVTTQIKMGPGVRPLPFHHPLQVAIEANACDQVTGGRYLLGFGLGGPETGAKAMKQRGLDENHRRDMMHESIDFIMKAFTATEPFDYHGEFWQGEEIDLRPKSVQKPHVPVAVASTGTPSTMEMAGHNGFLPLFSQYDEAHHIHDSAEIMLEAARASGRPPARNAMRACRYVYVADSVAQAKDDLRADMTPSIERHKEFFPHHFEHSLPPSGRVEDVTFDFLIDSGHYFAGDPDTVYEEIKNFYDECGGIGVLLLLAGKDYGTREQRARSWETFMQEVAPRLRTLDPDQPSQPA
jgi:alkanesulfonate monooxygenase SsuD/methylene tetrahydromethanopterin reductase-like flavin-dependent oxidoreductase (luciferase family)